MSTTTREPDLNRLRDLVRQNQRTGDVRPNDPNKQVTVDREGNLHVGNAPGGQPTSKVPQEVFADRLAEDRTIARRKMPTNTVEITTAEGVTGFLYSVASELRDTYKMFAYFDGAFYQVKVLEPALEERWHSPHTGHLWKDGRICFGQAFGSGMPTLEDAFAKSCLWANGMSVALRDPNNKFPFSINNIG